ncbi:hypothetical protein ACLOAV_008309 [Pseudogymnoascus australis]
MGELSYLVLSLTIADGNSFIVIFGDVFQNPSSGILKVFDIDTTKIRVIENATLRINGWPSEKVKCASYFGGLLAVGTTSNRLYLFRIIITRDAIDDDVKVMIEAIESDPFINGIYDYHTRGTKAVTFDSSPSIEDVQIDAQVLQLLSKKGSDHYIQAFYPGDKDRFAMPIGHDMYTIGLRPDLHQTEKYRRRSGDNKVSASKEKLLEWGREATTYEQLYDNNGRYIAIWYVTLPQEVRKWFNKIVELEHGWDGDAYKRRRLDKGQSNDNADRRPDTGQGGSIEDLKLWKEEQENWVKPNSLAFINGPETGGVLVVTPYGLSVRICNMVRNLIFRKTEDEKGCCKSLS